MHFTVRACLAAIAITASLGASADSTSAVAPYYATPSWDQLLPASSRFVLLANWNNDAVLDRETGLVWPRDPMKGISVYRSPAVTVDLIEAQLRCGTMNLAGRSGWRLPTASELQSLLDLSQPMRTLALPTGHPFLNVMTETDLYWTSSINPVYQNDDVVGRHYPIFIVQSVRIPGPFDDALSQRESGARKGVWCVRGPGGR